MYPLNVSLPSPAIGFAVANDENEHKALTEAGYVPAFAESSEPTLESVREQLDALGIEYDRRLGLSKLIELIPQ